MSHFSDKNHLGGGPHPERRKREGRSELARLALRPSATLPRENFLPVDRADMDARERVRSAVKQLYKKRGIGISGIECLSAREAFAEMNLGEQERGRLGDMYDAARYSSHEITDAQAEEARRTVK